MSEWWGVERHVWAWIVGGVFSGMAVVISSVGIHHHLHKNTEDLLRKYVIRILFMVPIYAVAAFLGLLLKEYTMYWDVFREFYESVTIYAFYMFLVGYLGGSLRIIETLRTKPQQKHLFPFGCLREWTMGEHFYRATRRGVLQYVVVRLILALLTFILAAVHLYGEGAFRPDRGYVYISFINNASQIWAMYCLVLFYVALAENLQPIRPMPKFLCIKAVVFFTFWQSLVIAGLIRVGVLHETETYSIDNVSSGLQDFCICIEMFFAAWGHAYAFPYTEFYQPATKSNAPTLGRLASVISVSDLLHGDARHEGEFHAIPEDDEGGSADPPPKPQPSPAKSSTPLIQH